MSFESYTDCIFQAFKSHYKSIEVVNRKKEILNGVSLFHNYKPDSVLYIGFTPAILAETAANISVTLVKPEIIEFLKERKVKFTYIPYEQLKKFNKQFDVVVALDEFFTFAKTDIEQKDLVTNICDLTREYIITTCKDYKNQEYKDREFSIPAIVRNDQNKNIYLEFHDHDLNDRNSWNTEVFEIKNNILNTCGPFARRALFFKQLAKFSADAGSIGFTVHKNLMYKSLIKKNYEHVISIRFDNDEPQRTY